MDYYIAAAQLHTHIFKVEIIPFIKVQVVSKAKKVETLQLTLQQLTLINV